MIDIDQLLSLFKKKSWKRIFCRRFSSGVKYYWHRTIVGNNCHIDCVWERRYL